jgi:hypothetical protein
MGKGANWGRCSKRAPSRWMFILVSNFDSLYPLSKLLFVKNFFSINEIQKICNNFMLIIITIRDIVRIPSVDKPCCQLVSQT